MPQTETHKMHTPGSWESLKHQCTFEFNGMRCGLKEGHEGSHEGAMSRDNEVSRTYSGPRDNTPEIPECFTQDQATEMLAGAKYSATAIRSLADQGMTRLTDTRWLLQRHAEMLEALELAAKYVAKMVADDVNTVVPPANALRVIEAAIRKAKAQP